MIPKMKKTYCERLKTNSFNKLFIQDFYGSDKGHIRKPLNSKRWKKDNQSGFTSKRRIEDNILILQYCIENCYIKKKPLFAASVDFNKAFDSIKRRALTFKVVTSDIEGINVVDSIKYLGVTINNTRKCFTRQKRIMIEEAQKNGNVILLYNS